MFLVYKSNRALVAIALCGVALLSLTACGGSSGGPTVGGLRSYANAEIDAVKSGKASELVKVSEHDACPLSLPDAVVALAMVKAFGVDLADLADAVHIDSVTVVGNHGTVVASGGSTSYTYANGHWGEDMPAGGCDDGTGLFSS